MNFFTSASEAKPSEPKQTEQKTQEEKPKKNGGNLEEQIKYNAGVQ